MYAGQIVEQAPARELLRRPLHPYTQALMRSVPEIGQRRDRLEAIPGTVPSPGTWPAGCRFAPRCRVARSECAYLQPQLVPVADERVVRCPFWDA
jgi:oligopeptide/dipeptide ABC transporter ATP-binding protein